MIYRYNFCNFFSFAEEVEVSFIQNKLVPESDSIVEGVTGQRLTKIMAVMGPNASGKTNLLKPLPFVFWFMNHSFQLRPEDLIPLEGHMLDPSRPSEFEIEFEHKGDQWKYQLTATRERVLHEALFRKVTRYNYIFVREWRQENNSYDVKLKGLGLTKPLAKKARKNASLISTAVQYDSELAKAFKDYFWFESNVDFTGRVNSPKGSLNDLIHASHFFKQNKELMQLMKTLVRSWDLGLSDIEVRELKTAPESDTDTDTVELLVGIHKNDKGTFELLFPQESSGTQTAVTMLYKILPVLKLGGIAVIDELESDLHPHMLEPILNLFIDERTNPHNAQIIFTCHAAEVLNLLHKSQVTLVEKRNHCSDAWRLDEIQGIRPDENLYAKYMAGAYSAVPQM